MLNPLSSASRLSHYPPTWLVFLVAYAPPDDFAAGFEHRGEAERFLAELRERFAQFGLALHPDKARLIEFGRFADKNLFDFDHSPSLDTPVGQALPPSVDCTPP